MQLHEDSKQKGIQAGNEVESVEEGFAKSLKVGEHE